MSAVSSFESAIARVFILIMLLAGGNLHAQQAGELDQSFVTGIGFYSGQYGPGSMFAPGIGKIAVQPDNKIIVTGGFTSYNGAACNRIVRLNPDGSLDPSFNAGLGPNSSIFDFAIQPDGKIVLVGGFILYNGMAAYRVVRINPDGTVDTSFQPGWGFNKDVYAVAIQPDGKILVGGYFFSFNNLPCTNMVRLNMDGSRDTSFDTGLSSDRVIKDIAVQADGKILVAGDFASFNGTTKKALARLNTDGSVDASFNTSNGATYGAGYAGDIRSLILQPDGKIIIGGGFERYNNVYRENIARINPDASLDTDFNAGAGTSTWYLQSILQQPNGKIILTGDFVPASGSVVHTVIRINADGSMDPDFSREIRGNPTHATSAALQPDGKVIIGGTFSTYQGINQKQLARIFGDPVNGLTERSEVAPSLFPNPTSAAFKIDLSSVSDARYAKISVINSIGKLVSSFTIPGGSASEISTKGLNPGIYLIQIQTPEKVYRKQLVIQ